MKSTQLPVPLLLRERTWGWRYLLFQLFFLGPLLALLLSLISGGSNGPLLDCVYFGVNLVAVAWIFRSFTPSFLSPALRFMVPSPCTDML